MSILSVRRGCDTTRIIKGLRKHGNFDASRVAGVVSLWFLKLILLQCQSRNSYENESYKSLLRLCASKMQVSVSVEFALLCRDAKLCVKFNGVYYSFAYYCFFHSISTLVILGNAKLTMFLYPKVTIKVPNQACKRKGQSF